MVHAFSDQPNRHRGSNHRGDVSGVRAFSASNWAVLGFVLVVLFPMAIVLSLKRMHVESRLARTLCSP